MRRFAVLRLPFRGPRDEFLPLRANPSLDVDWVTPHQFATRFPDGVDVIILPGSSATVKDLEYLKASGGADLILKHVSAGGMVVGICGGYQILGGKIFDPLRRQGRLAVTEGLGLLPQRTLFGPKLFDCDSTGHCLLKPLKGAVVTGEEHRSGYSWVEPGEDRQFEPLIGVDTRQPTGKNASLIGLTAEVDGKLWSPLTETVDGFVSRDRKVWGCYWHMIFHCPTFNELLFACLPA